MGILWVNYGKRDLFMGFGFEFKMVSIVENLFIRRFVFFYVSRRMIRVFSFRLLVYFEF